MQRSIDIRPDDLVFVQKTLIAILSPNTKVWVFGSRAKGTIKKASDLDLLIDAGRLLTKKETSALAEAFEESNLPYKVDIVDWHNISDIFKQIIEEDMIALPL